MKELLTTLITRLVDKPDEVEINEREDEGTIKYRVKVAPDDVGKIIGKKGQTISALRTIFKAIGAKENHKRVLVESDDF